MKRLLTGLTGLILIVSTVACGGDPEPVNPSSPSTPSAATPATAPTPGGGGGAAAPTAAPRPAVPPRPADTWTSSPTTVRHDVAVPPVPRITGIRSAQHPADGYDRVVLDIAGSIPSYRIQYVDQPVQDGSGLPANVAGRRFLQIRLEPAQAHTDAGQATTPRSRTVNYPMIEAWAITGDYEGVVTVVLGLDDIVGYRVGELPGRVYIDVAA